jgi:hypothetical protein
MSDQVFRYHTKEEYLDPEEPGIPISPKFKTWDEAVKVRDTLREGESPYYYNIIHFSGVSVEDSNAYV